MKINKYANMIFTLALCVFLVGVAYVPSTTASAQDEGFITGTIIDSDTSQPIVNLQVNANDYETGEWIAGTRTDASGNYTLTVPTGSYIVGTHAAFTGLYYSDEYYDNALNQGEATPVQVIASQNTPNINFSLEPAGSISGTIYEADGETHIANVLVAAQIPAKLFEWFASAQTDSSGHYTIYGLPAGTYLVRAFPSYNGLPYVNKWYDDEYFRENSTPVTVAILADTPNIDFILETGGSISGYIYKESDNSAIQGAVVSAHGHGTGERYGGAVADVDGYYQLGGLPSGEYDIIVSATGFANEWYSEVSPDTYFEEDATAVVVSPPADTPGINFHMVPGGTISGHVYKSDNITPISGAIISIYGSGNFTCGIGISQLDGSYTTLGGFIGGDYKVKVEVAGYITQWYDGVYEKADATSVTVTVPDDTPDINFSLEPDGSIADIILINGQVVTMEPDMPQAEALAVLGEYILAVGTNDEILAFNGPQTQVIDLEGKALLPGFVDPHNHRFNASLFSGFTLEEAQQMALESGTTTMANMYTDPYVLGEMQTFEQQGKLRVRTSLYLCYNDNCGVVRENLGDWYKNYTPITDPSAMLRIIGVKIFSDGGTCMRPAFSLDLPESFVIDDPKGDLFISEGELATVIGEIQASGFQAAVHAMGDRAVETVLNAYETALAGQPNTYRHRIEHNANIRPELLTRYGQLDIVPTMFGRPFNFLFMLPDYWWRAFIDKHGESVRSWVNPVRSLLDANPGLHVAWKSDNPVVNDSGPIADLYGLVTRKEPAPWGGGIVESPAWIAAEAVSVEEALRMMTIEAAYALFMEDWVGNLKPGKFADLIVLSDNPHEVAPDSLIDLKVLLTMVGGKVEYSVPGLNPANIGGTISGHVYQQDGITPIAGARVVAYDDMQLQLGQGWVVRGTAVTDGQGYYMIDRLLTGRYTVRAQASEEGYAGEYYWNSDNLSARARVSVTAPAETPDIDFTLETGGTISGQVVCLEKGMPIPIANLGMYAVDVQTGEVMAFVTTNGEGYYIMGLPAGTYWVRAFSPATGLCYVPEWYDDVITLNDATQVAVTMGENTPDINFSLERIAGTTVSINAPPSVVTGGDFTVTIDISDIVNLDACNYEVSFDPTILRLDYVTSGIIHGNLIPVVGWSEKYSGTYGIVQDIPGVSGVSGSGYLATLHFHVIGSEGDSSNILLANGILSNTLGVEISAIWVGDLVNIFSVVPGDANSDGAVNALDMTKVARIILELDDPTPGADANQNGDINVLDITRIARIILGLAAPMGAEVTFYDKGFLVERPHLRNFPPVLCVQGTPYEMGYQHGYLMRDYIVDHYSGILTYIYSEIGGWEPDGVTIPTPEQWETGRDIAVSAYYDLFDALVQEETPQLYQEALGIAAGLEARYQSEGLECPIPLEDVLYFNFWGTVGSQGCSNFAAWGAATKNGETIHAQNLDWYDINGTHRNISVMVVSPDQGNAFLLIFGPGMVVGLAGMNEQGVTSSIMKSDSVNDSPTTQISLEMSRRLALQFSNNIQDTYEILEQYMGAISGVDGGNNVLIVDGIGDGTPNGAVIELSGTEMAIRYEDPGFLPDVIWSTNHYNCYPGWQGYEGYNMVPGQIAFWGIPWEQADTVDEWQAVLQELNPIGFTWSRYERYRELISENHGNIDSFKAMDFQSDTTILYYKGLTCNSPVEILAPECVQMFGIVRPITRQWIFSIFSVIYAPSDGVAWVAVGAKPAQIGTYWPVNLTQYLQALHDFSFENLIPDSDGDEMPDDWELAYRLDPNIPADAAIDTDGDGATNLEEYMSGTDPTSIVEYEDAPECGG